MRTGCSKYASFEGPAVFVTAKRAPRSMNGPFYAAPRGPGPCDSAPGAKTGGEGRMRTSGASRIPPRAAPPSITAARCRIRPSNCGHMLSRAGGAHPGVRTGKGALFFINSEKTRAEHTLINLYLFYIERRFRRRSSKVLGTLSTPTLYPCATPMSIPFFSFLSPARSRAARAGRHAFLPPRNGRESFAAFGPDGGTDIPERA